MKFRDYHVYSVLERFDLQEIPLDIFLNRYFRAHKAIGSKDRVAIAEKVYHHIKWKNLFEYLGEVIEDPRNLLGRKDIPPHISHGTPLPLYELLVSAYGVEEAHRICIINNTRAPLTARANQLKISREELLAKLSKQYRVFSCRHSPMGFQFGERVNLQESIWFRQGLFEIQDEGSQLAAALVRVSPRQKVLDYCAGSGGKSLSFCHGLAHTGQIYLHDIRSVPLKRAKERFRRAGVQNVQFSLPSFKGGPYSGMDWVVVDVPCSGTGTFRRNPDLKWRFSLSNLRELAVKQRLIFEEALSYLRPSGTIVYITCSVLPMENEEQIAYFKDAFHLEVVESFRTLPVEGGMDGFFATSLRAR